MRKKTSPHERGVKAAETIRQRYGVSAFSRWAKLRQSANRPHKFTKDNASQHAKVGGLKSKRGRIVKVDEDLHSDEWTLLITYANRAIGKLRLIDESKMSAIDQHIYWHKMQELRAEKNWLPIMTDLVDHYDWPFALEWVIDNEIKKYQSRFMENHGLTSQEAECYRVARNLRCAFKAAQREHNKCPEKAK